VDADDQQRWDVRSLDEVDEVAMNDKYYGNVDYTLPTEELVAGGSGRVLDIVFEDEVLQKMAHVVACRQLGLDPDKVVVGGDETDRNTLRQDNGLWCLMESDPKYDKYWEYSSTFWMRVLGNALTSSAPRLLY